MVVVLRGPAEERERRRIQHRPGIEHLEDRLQAPRGNFGGVGAPHDYAHQMPAAERNPDARAGCGRVRAGRCRGKVIEQPSERGVERHPKDFDAGSHV